MSWYHWEYYPRKKAIPVKDGIKAKSQRGDIGETWWSQQFLDALYRFDIGARLDRGRRYARQGQVISIDVSKGLVEAKVQGSTRRPYSVEIRIAPLNDRDWRRVEKAMGARAIFLAKLLAGEMPKNIEEAFSECKLSLFPRKMSDIETECSCPDWSNPCKHIAAVYFIMAERFDSDPFLLFTLRGRTKEEALEYLSGIKPKDEIRKETVEDIARFWDVGPEFDSINVCPAYPEREYPILSMLGPLPLDGSYDLKLKELYRIASAKALELSER